MTIWCDFVSLVGSLSKYVYLPNFIYSGWVIRFAKYEMKYLMNNTSPDSTSSCRWTKFCMGVQWQMLGWSNDLDKNQIGVK